MPRNTAYMQELVKSLGSPQVTFTNDEFVASRENGNETQLPQGIKEEHVIFIASSDEGPESQFLVFCLSENPEDPEQPFQLLSLSAANLPEELLRTHKIDVSAGLFGGDAKHELYVIVSILSGVGLAQRFFDEVLQLLLSAFGLCPVTSIDHATGSRHYDLIVTQSSESIKEFARRGWPPLVPESAGKPSNNTKKRSIILLSGDGGVVDLLNGASDGGDRGVTPTISLLPLGTGNALFHSLHKPHYATTKGPAPSPLVLGLRTLFRGTPRPLPTFRAAFSPGSTLVSSTETSKDDQQPVSHLLGAIVASYGFHAQLVWESDTPAYRAHGEKRFAMVAEELLKTSHAYRARVEVRAPGGHPLADPASAAARLLRGDRFGYVLVALVSNLERAFTISPASEPLDGKLRLVSFGDVGGARTMEIMRKAYDGGAHVGMKWTVEGGGEEDVGYEEVEEVKVTVLEADARWRKVCVDGTIVEIPQGGWMSVSKMASSTYRVLVH